MMITTMRWMDRWIDGWIDGKFGEQSRQVTTTDVRVTTGDNLNIFCLRKFGKEGRARVTHVSFFEDDGHTRREKEHK